MSPVTAGLICAVLLLVLLVFGIPIAFALAVAGMLGIVLVDGVPAALAQLGFVAWQQTTEFVMVCVPLFIIMGLFVFHCGLGKQIYDACYKWAGRLPGGLAVSTVLGCAAFGAVTGSSMAAVATIGSISMPYMKTYHYDNRLATGCLATAGTLAILIPPSLAMVVYAVMTGESIGKLFIGGILPGLLTTLMFVVSIIVQVVWKPSLGPVGPKFPLREKMKASVGMWPVVLLFLIVIGGIYTGMVTATEAAGFGAFGAFVITAAMRRMSRRAFLDSVADTGRLSAMIFTLIIGALLFSRFMIITGLIPKIVGSVTALAINRYVLLGLIVIMYIILGCFLETVGMLALTLPVVYPIILGLGFDSIWFGIIIVKMIEIGLVTPPVGLNVFVIKSIAPDVPMEQVFLGCLPFILTDLVTVAILVAFPAISLWLPATMFK